MTVRLDLQIVEGWSESALPVSVVLGSAVRVRLGMSVVCSVRSQSGSGACHKVNRAGQLELDWDVSPWCV